MPIKRRSTRKTKQAKRVDTIFGDSIAIVAHADSQDRLTMREAVFARLIVSEGMNKTDAYREAFKPSHEAKPDSVNQMACRIARKIRVSREIDRLRRQAQEIENGKENRPALLKDGSWLSDQILAGLYDLATNSPNEAVRYNAWVSLGKSKHVNLFANATFNKTVTNNTQVNNNLGVDTSQGADDIRSQLKTRLSALTSDARALPAPQAVVASRNVREPEVIELKAER